MKRGGGGRRARSRVWVACLVACWLGSGGCAHPGGATPASIPAPSPSGVDRKAPPPSDAAVEALGAFSRIEHRGEHAYGQSVQLWRSAGQLVGLLLVYVGSEGDPPTGQLEDVVYSPSSGALSFRARLTLGMLVQSNGRKSPSRDLFVFRGTLTERTLSGVFEISDRSNPEVPARREMVSLALDADAKLAGRSSLAAWRAQVKETLATRGPKW